MDNIHGHIIRSDQYKPSRTRNVTVHHSGEHFAILRDNDTIDICDSRINFFIQRTLVLGTCNILHIFYIRDFLCCYDSSSRIYRIDHNKLVFQMSCDEGAITCCDSSNKHNKIAFGTTTGYIMCVDVVGDYFQCNYTLQRQTDIPSSIVFDDERDLLIGGCGESLKVWDISSGKLTQSLALPSPNSTKPANKPVITSIHFLSDGIVVTGDNRGNTSFWNVSVGFLAQSIKAHSAPIRHISTTSVADKKPRLFSAGDDGVIVRYDCEPSTESWILSSHMRVYNYPIVALTSLQSRFLLSACVDGSLAILRGLTPSAILRISPVASLKSARVVQVMNGFMVMSYDHKFEVWKFSGGKRKGFGGQTVESPVCLTNVTMESRLVAIAADKSLNCVGFVTTNGKLAVARFSCLESGEPSVGFAKCSVRVNPIKMSMNGGKIFMLMPSNAIFCGNAIDPLFDLEEFKCKIIDAGIFVDLEITTCGLFLALVDSVGEVYVVNTCTGGSVKMPKAGDVVTCLCFHPSDAVLCVVYSLGTVVEFGYEVGEHRVVYEGRAVQSGRFGQVCWSGAAYGPGEDLFLSSTDCLGRISRGGKNSVMRRTGCYSVKVQSCDMSRIWCSGGFWAMGMCSLWRFTTLPRGSNVSHVGFLGLDFIRFFKYFERREN